MLPRLPRGPGRHILKKLKSQELVRAENLLLGGSNIATQGPIDPIPVCEVEGFLHAIPMMDVNVDVQHPCVVLEQL